MDHLGIVPIDFCFAKWYKGISDIVEALYQPSLDISTPSCLAHFVEHGLEGRHVTLVFLGPESNNYPLMMSK